MSIHHEVTESRRKGKKSITPCLSASLVGVSWEQPKEPQPEWRNRDVGGAFEQLEERLTRDRGVYWRFFYSRDPKRRDITGKKAC